MGRRLRAALLTVAILFAVVSAAAPLVYATPTDDPPEITAPDPEPTPNPDPDPDPTPTPNPDPDPTPTPNPDPDPTPTPDLEPDPGPTPGPTEPVYPDAPAQGQSQTEELPSAQIADDLRLSFLSIDCGELVPAFSPDVYQYTVYITPEQEERSCSVEANPMDERASVVYEGPLTIETSDIVRTITVFDDVAETVYTITVHIITAGELLVDGVYYAVSDTPDLASLPGQFTAGEVVIDGEKRTAAQSADGQLLLIQYSSQTPGAWPLWYRCDLSTGKQYPVDIVETEGKRYIRISSGESVFYGSDNGEASFFIYDEKTGEWLYRTGRYETLAVQPAPEVIEKRVTTWPIIVLLGLWAVAATAGAIVYAKRNRKRREENCYWLHLTDEDAVELREIPMEENRK